MAGSWGTNMESQKKTIPINKQQTYPAVQVLEPGGILASHRQILVQDSAGLLAVKFLHSQETEDEV